MTGVLYANSGFIVFMIVLVRISWDIFLHIRLVSDKGLSSPAYFYTALVYFINCLRLSFVEWFSFVCVVLVLT